MIEEKKVKKLLKNLVNLSQKPGGYSHHNGWADVYNPPYYSDEEIKKLQKKARKILKHFEDDEEDW